MGVLALLFLFLANLMYKSIKEKPSDAFEIGALFCTIFGIFSLLIDLVINLSYLRDHVSIK